jgi:hypothetical protein
MALSDYERRVLREIEAELGRAPRPPLVVRLCSLPLVQALGWALLVAGCVCAAIFAPAPVAVLCVGIVGFGLGVLAGRATRRAGGVRLRPVRGPRRRGTSRT